MTVPTVQVPGIQRWRIGNTIVTALNDGHLVLPTDALQGISIEERDLLYRAAGRRPPVATAINGYLLQASGRTVLVDAGAGSLMEVTLGKLRGNLAAAGVSPESVDVVLLTHMHVDHIGGLLNADGTAAYPRATVMASMREVAYWRELDHRETSPQSTRDAFDVSARVMAAYGTRFMPFIGAAPLPGITAIALPGHTPGHTGYALGQRSDALIIWGDICHAPEMQCLRPEVTVIFDVSPEVAIASRHAMLRRAAVEDLVVAGMHMPFPGFTRIGLSAGGYQYQPQAWQYDLIG